VQVRLATADDADGIARVQERGWQGAYRHIFPPEKLDRGGFIDPERWRARLRTPPPGWTTLVAAADEVVGFASIGPSRDEEGLGELYAIYVDPDAWDTGAGRALMERAEQHLAEEYDEATLWVLEDNARARRFYAVAGWSPDGAAKEGRWFDLSVIEVRYRKSFASSSTSRS
jgi:ribosomal protein S18 acetylase RimI-like enzyme